MLCLAGEGHGVVGRSRPESNDAKRGDAALAQIAFFVTVLTIVWKREKTHMSTCITGWASESAVCVSRKKDSSADGDVRTEHLLLGALV